MIVYSRWKTYDIFFQVCKNIRIHHECEGWIGKSVSRITVWHHEACRVMTNGDQEGRIFFYPILIQKMDSILCSSLHTEFRVLKNVQVP